MSGANDPHFSCILTSELRSIFLRLREVDDDAPKAARFYVHSVRMPYATANNTFDHIADIFVNSLWTCYQAQYSLSGSKKLILHLLIRGKT